MSCELCGRESGCRAGVIDGVKMMLCPECIKHGEGVKDVAKTSSSIKSVVFRRIKKSSPRDVYKGMEKELVPDWSDVIKKARKKKGLSREELGFKIEERTVTISKVENGNLRPSDKIVAKLEKELGISLLEQVKEITTPHHSSKGMTLGDFIKHE